jgi:arylsulfatase A-like enzyme
MLYIKTIIAATSLFLLAGCYNKDSESTSRPNIILILADDMGYTDIGCYGSEINTPNIDKLAKNGLMFTQFYNAARCSPSRASMLTGLYPHQAGMGGNAKSQHKSTPGPYQGYINNTSVTLAEVLSDAGYYTAISGKWHLGDDLPHWPMDRGFDNFFGLINGAANFFDIHRGRYPDTKTLHLIDSMEYQQPADFYMTDAITDHALGFLQKGMSTSQPFFLYLSYTAPHWPMHARQEDIDKYRGTYLKGWDVLRQERIEKMISLGLLSSSLPDVYRDQSVPPWDSLTDTQKDKMDLLMAIYAAMIDRMDQGIGRVINFLAETGELNNTLIFFLSDNGACAEWDVLGTDVWGNFLDSNVRPGSGDTFHTYGRAWAHLGNVPFRMYKKYTHEGGISTPLIVHWPDGVKNKGSIIDHPGHIIDIMPTFCELAEVDYPLEFNGNTITPSPGISLAPLFKGETPEAHQALYWEHAKNKAIRKGDWKLVSMGGADWELYNMKNDRYELNNLIRDEKLLADSLMTEFQVWADEVGVR